MSRQRWEPGDVAALLVNPFYAVEIHPSLGLRHDHVMGEGKWIASNAQAIAELGPGTWLRYHLTALKEDHGRPGAVAQMRVTVADPYPAITVHPGLCLEHEPLVDEAMWIASNVPALSQEGHEAWLRNLVSVLKGAYPSSD